MWGQDNLNQMIKKIAEECVSYRCLFCDRNPDYPDSKARDDLFIEKSFFKNGEDLTVYIDFAGKNFCKNHIPFEEKRALMKLSPPEHTHEYVSLMYVASGTAYCYMDKKEYILNQGALYILNADTPHEIILGDDSINLFILIRPAALKVFLTSLIYEDNPFSHFLISSNCFSNFNFFPNSFFLCLVEEGSPLEYHLCELVYEWYSKKPFAQNGMKFVFCSIILDLIRQIQGIHSQKGKSPEYLLPRLLGYIDKNLSSCSLKDLSDHYHYSESYLSVFLKKETGKSFSEIKTSYRMHRAQQLLKYSHLSLQEIAAEVGYNERSHFEKVFKNQYGLTPSQYRKAHT